MNTKKPVQQMMVEEIAAEIEDSIYEATRLGAAMEITKNEIIQHAVRSEQLNLQMEKLLAAREAESEHVVDIDAPLTESMALKEICTELDRDFADWTPKEISRIYSSGPVDKSVVFENHTRLKRYTELTKAMLSLIQIG